ncbi:DUF456 domain-containing protein [Polaribacter tangerinus]|uniref:DUF456 domain-containing protein n=1 Tax=Polaribacter tangerinus TaxID=1920034 RepID=UPI000B4B9226|nr:DUF456 domain-containing protein [Polaribacter tangerinus]
MDIILLIVGFALMLLGIIGSFLPILPGPLTSWFGFLVLQYTSIVPFNWGFLGVTLAIAIIIWMIDYLIPAIGSKKFGGSKYGAYGTTIGLIIGLLSPIPFGIVIGAFLGAFLGELIFNNSTTKRAVKAAVGSLLGLLASSALKFFVSVVFFVLFVLQFWDYKSDFLSLF